MRSTGTRRGGGRAACAPAIAFAASAAAIMGPGSEPSAASSRIDPVERHVVWLINQQRSAYGKPYLRRVRSLARVADRHCRDMLRGGFFAHASRDGTPAVTRVLRFRRARRTGETLAYVHGVAPVDQARQFVRMWMASPPHRAVLLDGSFRRIGIARRAGTYGGHPVTVMTADFQSRR